jgi:GxxExxY protein
MEKEETEINEISERIIGCAIEVHRNIGPGLLESVYEDALCFEFGINGLLFQRQVPVPIIYKRKNLGEFRLDLLVNDKIIVELKAVDRMDPVFEAQLLSYLKMTGKKLGLLINFNVPILIKGVKRLIL